MSTPSPDVTADVEVPGHFGTVRLEAHPEYLPEALAQFIGAFQQMIIARGLQRVQLLIAFDAFNEDGTFHIPHTEPLQ